MQRALFTFASSICRACWATRLSLSARASLRPSTSRDRRSSFRGRPANASVCLPIDSSIRASNCPKRSSKTRLGAAGTLSNMSWTAALAASFVRASISDRRSEAVARCSSRALSSLDAPVCWTCISLRSAVSSARKELDSAACLSAAAHISASRPLTRSAMDEHLVADESIRLSSWSMRSVIALSKAILALAKSPLWFTSSKSDRIRSACDRGVTPVDSRLRTCLKP
mmetsp:Transcript_83246/g.254502  ORF Transcript_83246/g.254502 Transcript_83246/m.254502 type:complete len:227 (-) Transcript_83246:276-956(-)